MTAIPVTTAMHRHVTRLCRALAPIAIWLALGSAVQAQDVDIRNGFDIQIPATPVPFHLAGQLHLGYEVHLTNFSADRLKLTDVSVVDAGTGHVVTRLHGDCLIAATAIIGADSKPKALPEYIEPGRRAVLFLDYALPSGKPVAAVEHRITYVVADNETMHSIQTDALTLSAAKPSLIAPPLRGGPWVAVHSPDWPRGHRRVFYTVAGHVRLPGRFAIDFVKVDDQGRTTKGDPDVAAQTYGFGDDVLAVADGTVVAVRDGMDDPLKISQRTEHKPAEDAGNYVTLRLPDGRFAFYEHLRKGSIRVAVGHKVQTGDVLGSLGFTGESTGPHLHFHIANANSTLDAESLPFEIRSYRQLGQYKDISKLGSPWDVSAEEKQSTRRNEWPDFNAVIDFNP